MIKVMLAVEGADKLKKKRSYSTDRLSYNEHF